MLASFVFMYFWGIALEGGLGWDFSVGYFQNVACSSGWFLQIFYPRFIKPIIVIVHINSMPPFEYNSP